MCKGGLGYTPLLCKPYLVDEQPFLPVPSDPDHCGLCLQVRTLFVSGLPVDIKPRELYLLFRPFKVSQDRGAPRAQDQG